MKSRNGTGRGYLFAVPAIAAAAVTAIALTAAPTPRAVAAEATASPEQVATEPVLNGGWKIRATGARIVGGYGHNFAYDGKNVRSLEGQAEMTLNASEGKASLTIELETTDASGPIRFGKDQSWSGKIRIVQMIDTNEMEMARIAELIDLHGNTGNEAPVMPDIFNYFATWGPSKIWVNGEEVIPMIGSHTMFSERSRNDDGAIVNAAGQVYTPMTADKSGFTDPGDTEFHYVAHTTQPDNDNFPPHTAWIHLNFSRVEVEQQPDGIKIPYERK